MRYKWFKTHTEVYEELLEDEEEAKKQKYTALLNETEAIDPASPAGIKKRIASRNELFGSIIALVVFLYGVFTVDVPITYIGLAFLLFEGRFLTKLLPEEKGAFADRIMYILSIFLFFGAFVIAFA